MLAGAVALSVSACGLVGEGASPSSSTTSQVPLATTSTTDPTTSPTAAGPDGPRPTAPDAPTLLGAMRDHIATVGTVTIEGDLHDDDRDQMLRLQVEGSTGSPGQANPHGGASRFTVTLDEGGRLEGVVIGDSHYVRVDREWLDTREVRRASPLRSRVGEWARIPSENSPIERFKPYRLLKDYFGQGLPPADARNSPSSGAALDDRWTYLVQVNQVSGSGRGGTGDGQRQLWLTTGPQTRLIQMTRGRSPDRTRLRYSGWGTTSDTFSPPAGARTIKELSDRDL